MILIFESDYEVSKRLESAAKIACPRDKVVICHNHKDAVYAAMEEEVDIFVVDIEGNSKNDGILLGIEYVKRLRMTETYRFTDVFLVVEPGDVGSFLFPDIIISGFIYKPVDLDSTAVQLLYVYKRLKHWSDKYFDKKKSIFYKKRNRIEVIMISDVVWTEKHEREYIIKTRFTERRYDVRASECFVKKFENSGFIKINQSDSINPDYLVGFDYYNVYLYGFEEGRRLGDIGREGLKRLFKYVNQDKIE